MTKKGSIVTPTIRKEEKDQQKTLEHLFEDRKNES